jgi:hypothetical protein
MFLLVVAAYVGSLATAAILWSQGVLVAVAAAPLGGSLIALVVSLLLAWVRIRADHKSSPVNSRTRSVAHDHVLGSAS